MDLRGSVTQAMCVVALIICQSMSVGSAESNGSGDSSQLLNLPLFRPPTQQEVDESLMPILWSAHETGDTSRMLPDNEALIVCLLDGVGENLTMPLHSLIWTLESNDSGYRSQYRLRRDKSHFESTVDGLWMSGQYYETLGSRLHINPRKPMQMRMKIRCEYQLAGQSATIKSTWLILWDENSEASRIRNAFLNCNRTAYHRYQVRNTPIAVAYICSGFEETRLVESATLSVYSGHEETVKNRKVVVKLAEIFSNCTSRDFFGFAFGGRVQFGWNVGYSNHTSSSSGTIIERTLAARGEKLGLSLFATLPSGRFFTFNYWVSTIINLPIVNISPEKSLLVLSPNGSGLEIQLDELQHSADRILPCPFLCLPDRRSVCHHHWVGPGGVGPPRTAPASQPNSLHLKSSDMQSAGVWTCAVQRSLQADSIVFAVSVKQRPLVCGPRIPRHSVVFPPDHFSINCSLCGLSAYAKVEFGVYSSIGAAEYSEERTKLRNKDGSVLLGLKFFDISPTSDGTTFILRCRGVEPDGRASGDFAVVHLLPLPPPKPLEVCDVNDKPCRFDCRSSVTHQLQSIGVSVSYIFSLYSMSGQLYMIVKESSGLLEDAREAAGGATNGALKAECQEFFYYKEDREGQSASQELKLKSHKTAEDWYRQQLGEQRYKQLILVLLHKSAEKHALEANKKNNVHSEPLWRAIKIFGIITAAISTLILIAVCILTGKKIRRSRHHLMSKIDSNNKAPESRAVGGGQQQPQEMSTARPLREETGVDESLNLHVAATNGKKSPLYPRISEYSKRMASYTQQMAPSTQQTAPNTQQMASNTQQMTPNTQQTAPNTQQMAPNTQQMGPNTQQMSTGYYQGPMGPNKMQHSPSQIPMSMNQQMPMGTNQMPMGTNQMPIGTNQMPMGTNQMPMGTNQMPMGTNQMPMGPNQMQLNQMSMGPYHVQQLSPNQVPMGPFQMQPNLNQTPVGPNQMQRNPNQMPMGPNQSQQSPSQVPISPNQMSMNPQQMQQSPNQMSTGPNQMMPEQQVLPSNEDQQQTSSQSSNFNAVQNGLEADVDMTSQSTRSAEASAIEDFECQGASNFFFDRASTDSESESPSKESETQSLRPANQHSCDNVFSLLRGRSDSTGKSVEPENDNAGIQHPGEASRSRSQLPASPISRSQSPTAPISTNQSPETSGIGFDFFLNQDSENFSNESQL